MWVASITFFSYYINISFKNIPVKNLLSSMIFQSVIGNQNSWDFGENGNLWPNVKDKSNNFWHAYSHILYEPLWKKVVPRLSTNFHINKKALENLAGIFRTDRGGGGGPISFKMSQNPKQARKNPCKRLFTEPRNIT